MDESEDETTLAAVGYGANEAFISLTSLSIRDYQGLQSDDLIEQQQRFDLWATNIGLYQKGHASLDYRFRDAPAIYQYCRELLKELTRTLHILKSELLSPTTELLSDTTGATEVSSSDEDSLDGYEDETTAEAAFQSFVDCIDRLFRLSMKIRNPTTRTGLSKGYRYRQIDEDTGIDVFDYFADCGIDEEHIRNILQNRGSDRSSTHTVPSYLINRLGKANNRRRRQFAYWRQHRLKLGRSRDRAVTTEDQQQVRVITVTPSISERSKPTTATHLDQTKVKVEDDTQSVVSTISMRIPDLVGSSNEINTFPDIPARYASQKNIKEFECPYCYTICPRRLLSQREWRAHILKDIRPYVCTYEECSSGTQIYDSFSDWFNHESSHRTNVYDSSFESAAHHIASHLIRVALFSLPRSTGVEVEADNQSANTNRNAIESRTTDSNSLMSTAAGPLSFDSQPVTPHTESVASDRHDTEAKQAVLQTSWQDNSQAASFSGEASRSIDKPESEGTDVEIRNVKKDSVKSPTAPHETIVILSKQLQSQGVDLSALREYDTLLYAASCNGRDDMVQFLIVKGADINALGGPYGTALHAASRGGYLTIVDVLLNEGADVEALGGGYETPLHAASRKGHYKIANLLLSKGADANGSGICGTALYVASRGGYLAVVQLLLRSGARVDDPGIHGTPLYVASREGHLRVVEVLLNKGADVNAREGNHATAIQAAWAGEHQAVIELLLRNGANHDI